MIIFCIIEEENEDIFHLICNVLKWNLDIELLTDQIESVKCPQSRPVLLLRRKLKRQAEENVILHLFTIKRPTLTLYQIKS